MSLTREEVNEILAIDYEAEADRIASGIRSSLRTHLHRRGLVVAVSGGIDSSVCAALAVRAVGAGKVFGILMPDNDSSAFSTSRGEKLVEHLRIQHALQDIGAVLEAIGCYQERDKAIRKVIPEYGPSWRSKIVIAGGMQGQVNHFNLVAQEPNGTITKTRLPLSSYLTIVAATNHKQRIRKTIEYYHADRLNYAVVGTPNHLEYDQGFFVKNGDGSADVKPIAHLFKTQVYAMARHLNLPEEICSAEPTTDTYSLPQGQDEFYFALPYHLMDIALHYQELGKEPLELGRIMNIDPKQAEQIYADIDRKRATTQYLHLPPVLLNAKNQSQKCS